MIHFKRLLAGAMVVTLAVALFALLDIAMKHVSGLELLGVFLMFCSYGIGIEFFPAIGSSQEGRND